VIPPADDPRPLVVYDGDCSFCARTVRLGARLDRRGRLRWAPAAGPIDSLLVRLPGGGTLREVDAVAAVVAAWPVVGRPLAALMRLARPLLTPVYRRVARHRGSLARALDRVGPRRPGP
jgi:predicted DCC family thiol-disulfide oxidoreductase YuxK